MEETQAAPPARWPVAEPFAIGGLEISNRLVQPPLAGIANWAFRRQSRRHGAGLAVSEMIASFGIRYANRKTLGMLTIVPDEHPVGVQIFGADPAPWSRPPSRCEAAGADLIDINMGCPVNKICKTGAGAALLADPVAAAHIVEVMVRAVNVPGHRQDAPRADPEHLRPGRDGPPLRGGRRRRPLPAPARRRRGVRRHGRPPHHRRGGRGRRHPGHRQRRHRDPRRRPARARGHRAARRSPWAAPPSATRGPSARS